MSAAHEDDLTLSWRQAVEASGDGVAALDEVELVVVAYGEDLTQSEIGARIRLSQMQVSRLLRRTLEHMQMLGAGSTVARSLALRSNGRKTVGHASGPSL